jgi:SAM-dependent methyltransferase
MAAPRLVDPETGRTIEGEGVIDLLRGEDDPTSLHYSKQWGIATGYTEFIRNAPTAARFTLARQLGWPDLFDRVRTQASIRDVSVYDAACGFGLIFSDLFAPPIPAALSYIGADIHDALATIDNPHEHAQFVRWDISNRLPTPDTFDFVVCRAAIHHTPQPQLTFRNLVSVLAPGGTLAISAYTKKTPMREAVDSALRDRITELSPDEGFAIARQFTALGRDLRATEGEIIINDDLPFLGIKAGRYPVQQFIYDHLMKCWFNPEFGDWSDIVNFDWYHPPYAYRYELAELECWYRDAGLTVVKTASNKAQHYVEGVL